MPQAPPIAFRLDGPRAPRQSEALLRIRGLSIDRPDGVRVLRDVDLQLVEGELLVLLGASGAGKSTLMAAIEDRSALERRGFRVTATELVVSAQIGIVPQRGALFDHLSIAGNLKLALRNADPPSTAACGK